MTNITTARHTGRSLIPDTLCEQLTVRITAGHPEITRPLAGRIVDQTAAFLAAASAPTGEDLSPSSLVDIGWHTFLLYTRDYAEFCDRVAGTFIHHQPHNDTPGQSGDVAASLARTLAAIEAAGYETYPDLWAVTDTLDCSASGKDGNENTETQIPPPDAH